MFTILRLIILSIENSWRIISIPPDAAHRERGTAPGEDRVYPVQAGAHRRQPVPSESRTPGAGMSGPSMPPDSWPAAATSSGRNAAPIGVSKHAGAARCSRGSTRWPGPRQPGDLAVIVRMSGGSRCRTGSINTRSKAICTGRSGSSGPVGSR